MVSCAFLTIADMGDFVSDDELAVGQATVRNMSSGEQVPVPLEHVIVWLKGKLQRG